VNCGWEQLCVYVALMTMSHVISGVVFSAMQAGEHNVHVTRDGNDIVGSPFTVSVTEMEISHADGVKVYGRGLSEAQTGQPAQFYIDTSDAGQCLCLCLCLCVSVCVCLSVSVCLVASIAFYCKVTTDSATGS